MGPRGNYLSVSTRLPAARMNGLLWMGDRRCSYPPASFTTRMSPSFFNQMAVDVYDSSRRGFFQRRKSEHWGRGVSGLWGCGSDLSWTIYEAYGDKRILEDATVLDEQMVNTCAGHSPTISSVPGSRQ